MDFDDLDDIPLARLIKKAFVPDVVTKKSTDLGLSVHSQGSSSSKAEGRTDVCDDEPPAGDDDVVESVNTDDHNDKFSIDDNVDQGAHNDSQPETQL
uniref:Uncharacterized protein n=1 Tax=Cucumis melo TaxID=3656 RepID=A0A9I9EDV3_CUCME